LVEESVKSDQDAPAATKMDHRQRWREATPELNRERQRGYQRCYRRRKREEASQNHHMAIEKELLDQLLAGRDPSEVFAKVGLLDDHSHE